MTRGPKPLDPEVKQERQRVARREYEQQNKEECRQKARLRMQIYGVRGYHNPNEAQNRKTALPRLLHSAPRPPHQNPNHGATNAATAAPGAPACALSLRSGLSTKEVTSS
ncbi:hypothetical protein K438DRAFT_1770721 [Mycena galopus ATCC 62051]|nr:hypothetical protein K438DRAFT_1770721 [Mycena galopus ATCC 62051]